MNFSITIRNVQHIKELVFSSSLSKQGLTCIVGKNSAGKTTLIRAIRNLKQSDTFRQTAGPSIFKKESEIIYEFGEKKYTFRFNDKLQSIDSKEIVDDEIKNSIHVELPIPYGDRFQYRTNSDIDDDLRRCISLQQYQTPINLIDLLNRIYNTDRFDSLRSVTVKGKTYYFLLAPDNFYIREDHFSTGEYFVIQLYRMVEKKCQLIVIDEIDISLDASAQARLLEQLRYLCERDKINVIFTTHSLALMKTLHSGELLYLDNSSGKTQISNVSYNYIKSLLFGFQGFDKYILTEDELLKSYIDYSISKLSDLNFCRHIVIYIGGAPNTVDLMRRSDTESFFSTNSILTILDGDQRDKPFCKNNERVLFSPFIEIEQQAEHHYCSSLDFPRIGNYNSPKDLFNKLITKGRMTHQEVFDAINDTDNEHVVEFRSRLHDFLTRI